MRRTLATFALALALVLAGCPAGESGTVSTTDDSPDGTATDGVGATQTPVPLADEHPYVADGSLDVSGLLTAHIQRLRSVESYTLGYNLTAAFAANGSDSGSLTRVDNVDLADERAVFLVRQRGSDGEASESGQYRNATHACSIQQGELACNEAAFDEQRVVALAVETTSLETLGAPDFEADGTVTRDGQGLYRYTATTLREDLPEQTATELGTNPALSEATLFVHPSGRIVEYEITYTTGSGDQRQRATFVYTTRDVNATSVPDAETLVSG
jgi:hypothetical protein